MVILTKPTYTSNILSNLWRFFLKLTNYFENLYRQASDQQCQRWSWRIELEALHYRYHYYEVTVNIEECYWLKGIPMVEEKSVQNQFHTYTVT